jgi:hypothetical protein
MDEDKRTLFDRLRDGCQEAIFAQMGERPHDLGYASVAAIKVDDPPAEGSLIMMMKLEFIPKEEMN